MQLDVSIDGMTCSHCVDSVRDALVRHPGACAVAVELGSARITLDDALTDKAAVFEVIRAAGAFRISGFSVSP